MSKKEFPAGHPQLAVENKGSKVTEVYVLFPDDRIVTERENIGAGTKANITAEIKAGDYEIACKPGMRGKGIRQQVKATGGGKAAKRDPALGLGGRRVPPVHAGTGEGDPAEGEGLRGGREVR